MVADLIDSAALGRGGGALLPRLRRLRAADLDAHLFEQGEGETDEKHTLPERIVGQRGLHGPERMTIFDHEAGGAIFHV